MFSRFRVPPTVELLPAPPVVDLSSSSTGMTVDAAFIRRIAIW
ncbi:hypothetical protein [Myxococcus stipitatus]|nr:hypothetical protein [Myxococcus stipitatus]